MQCPSTEWRTSSGNRVATIRKKRTQLLRQCTNFYGVANQLNEINIMLQSSPEMARIQNFLAKEGCDWNSTHHIDYNPENSGKQQ
jgi:hypothetical protein